MARKKTEREQLGATFNRLDEEMYAIESLLDLDEGYRARRAARIIARRHGLTRELEAFLATGQALKARIKAIISEKEKEMDAVEKKIARMDGSPW